MLYLTILILSLKSLWSSPIIRGESMGMKFMAEPIVSGLHLPWAMEFLSENEIIINEKNGNISIFNLTSKSKIELTGVPAVHEVGQGGLMDIRKHPKYPLEPWLYISYTEEFNDKDTTSLARFKIEGNKVVSFEKLMRAQAFSGTSRHFGSRIAFDDKGFLYFSIGERGVRENAQNLSNHAGSILRLNDDGTLPLDNPFVKQKGKLNEIWSYGHRNPQGLVFDASKKHLWVIEHGPRGGDELNLVEKGKNYGWPVISFGKEYWGPVAVGESTHKKGMEPPIHYYDPSIAPCGLEIYDGNLFPKWKGNLFTGALKLTHLNRIELNGTKFKKEERLLKDLNRRIRSVRQSPDGFLFFSTDAGEIYRISPVKSSKNSPFKQAN